jgi:hypothetical protein
VLDIMLPYDVTGLINKAIRRGVQGWKCRCEFLQRNARQAQVADHSAGKTKAVGEVETSGCHQQKTQRRSPRDYL